MSDIFRRIKFWYKSVQKKAPAIYHNCRTPQSLGYSYRRAFHWSIKLRHVARIRNHRVQLQGQFSRQRLSYIELVHKI
jgi:hypothetical protein